MVAPAVALWYGIALGIGGFLWLTVTTNVLAAALSFSGFLGYTLMYTVWLKRRTWQNIVWGGAAGAVPPLVGWAAVTGGLTGLPIYLFAIVFFWTPPHFWALSLLMKNEYARVGVPMLPVVRGEQETRRQIVLYSVLLYAVTQLPFCAGGLGLIYLAAALVLVCFPLPSCSVMIVPLSRNSSATSIVVCRPPPGLPRRSRMSPLQPLDSMFLPFARSSSWVRSANCEMAR